MAISRVFVDPRTTGKRTPDYIFAVRTAAGAVTHRYTTKPAAEAARLEESRR